MHKAIARKLLHHGAFLPQWLMFSYKVNRPPSDFQQNFNEGVNFIFLISQSHILLFQKRNAAELLRLILNSGRLLEANALALEYIGAVLGRGKEYFGLETPLVATAPAAWLPLSTLELLLLELEHASKTDHTYIEVH